jgi:hypothetical protein
LAFDPNRQAQDLVLHPFAHWLNLYVYLFLSASAALTSFPQRLLTSNISVELIGYAARGVSNKQRPNPTLAPYVIQTLLLLVAPALFAASIHMILGRIIVSVDGESLSLIKKRWLTKFFVTSDVLSFFIQLGGTYE